ncbi:MAG: hypothetical protein HY958_11180 [Bacteroidia bacterium]|nr:hypothetical protein [Bacteroidia bacterium]
MGNYFINNSLRILLIILILLVSTIAKSNNIKNDSIEKARVSIGIGVGFDQGGIGGRWSIKPISRFSVFVGAGYNLAGVGANAGTSLFFVPKQQIQPFFTVMYGYNAVLKIMNSNNSSVISKKIYMGPSVGFGLEFNSVNRKRYFSIALLYPFRDSKFYNDIKNVDLEFPILPVTISLGIHFILT